MNDAVRGLGEGGDPEGFVLQKFSVPLPSGMSAILSAIKDALSLGRVQSLLLELGKPIVGTRYVPEVEAEEEHRVESEGAMSLGEVSRNVPMEEYNGSKSESSPEEILVDVMMGLSVRRLVVTHIGLGPETRFFQWLGVDPLVYGGIGRFMGAEVGRDKSVPDDVLLLYASHRVGGRLEDVSLILKCHMFSKEGMTDV
jgi:hypothetical protein